jgi:flagellar P-ring protein precursor FlgI
MKLSAFKFVLLLAALFCITSPAHGVRIKDIADIKGVRDNQLVGYGLVVGLNGTGDSDNAIFTIQSFVSMLERMGVTVKPEDIEIDNVAAVMVTADLPAFARTGGRIDVLVSSIGDAENLQGGTLLFTPLKAADGQVYAIAQGPISTGGFVVGSASGSGVQKNFPTVGRVVNGALIEKDYDQIARTHDAGTIEVKVPDKYRGNIVSLVTMIERLGVTPDTVSKIVINERTGTVIMGENVRISTIAIAHGNLSIEIKEDQRVSQPLPFSRGGQIRCSGSGG